jgi:regulator of extracellular matrix RemA (YlzA/DUF370 family)
MDEADIEDLLSSDVKIIDITKNINGFLVWPGHLMPDGKQIVLQAPEKMDASTMMQWCNILRGEYRARKDRKEAEAKARAEAARVVDERNTPAPIDTGSSVRPVEASGEGREESVEELLQAKIASLERTVEHCRQVCAEAAALHDAAKGRHTRAVLDLDRARCALDAISADASEGSRTDRGQSERSTTTRRRKGRGGVVVATVRQDQ